MKLNKPKPPKTNSIGRRESGRFLTYDIYFSSLGKEKTEYQFLKNLQILTNASANFVKNNTTLDPLGSELLRQIYILKEPLSIVITGHLFIESFINHIIETKFKLSHLILENRDFTFNLKIEILKSKNYLDDKIYFDIKLLNQLRNKFAHNLLYNIADFDMSKFYYFDQVYTLIPLQTKKAKNALNIYLLRNGLKEIMFNLTSKYPSIGKLTMKK